MDVFISCFAHSARLFWLLYLPAHAVAEGAEQVGADEIGNAGRQKGDALLPALSTHRIHQPDR